MPDRAIAPSDTAARPTSAGDPTAFRAEFPVFERLSYLNAGTTGPVPRQAADVLQQRIDLDTRQGRCGQPYFEELMALRDQLRNAYAELLGCAPTELALTGSTTDGVNTVISGLDLRPGDEILTTDEEHPGLLAPLGRARRRHGISVRTVPFDEIAREVSPHTRLIACSHVSWVRGRLVDTAALAATGVPVLLDAAQAIGAIPVDVRALGCDFYAASGQKWLCGPEGSGCLYVREERLEELLIPWPGYGSLADPERALDLEPAEGAARLDLGFPTGIRSAWCLAALEVFAGAGWEWVHGRAAGLAAALADRLADLGLEVLPRGRSTLVSWKATDAKREVERLAAERVVVRSIPAFGVVRASVGAWSSEEELEALAQLAAASQPPRPRSSTSTNGA
jgi:L-cysteine/cystine lyase